MPAMNSAYRSSSCMGARRGTMSSRVKTVATPSLRRADEGSMTGAANPFRRAGGANQTVFHAEHAIEGRLHGESETTGHRLESCRPICELTGKTVPINSFHLVHVKMAAGEPD